MAPFLHEAAGWAVTRREEGTWNKADASIHSVAMVRPRHTRMPVANLF